MQDQRNVNWEEFLFNAPLPLKLPTDRHSLGDPAWLSESVSVSGPLARDLRSLCARRRVSLPAALSTAFLALLWRYTEQDELLLTCAVGHSRDLIPLSGSTHDGAPDMKTVDCSPQQSSPHALPLSVIISGPVSVTSLLTRVQQDLTAIHSRACVPLDSLSPLSQLVILFENETTPEIDHIGDLLDAGSHPFELLLHLRAQDESLQVSLRYNTKLFERSTIVRMLGHYETTLSSIVADSSRSLSDLNILPEAERLQITSTWNETKTDFPYDACLHELFEQQVLRRPEAPALFFGDVSLSYGELDARSNQLALHLQNLGVGPNSLVAISVDRSPEMVIGFLGILKAGGAYLPLDPEYPTERISFMLEDAGASVLLTQQHLLKSLPEVNAGSTTIVCIDRDWELIAHSSSEKPKSDVRPGNLVYVIYTSGSTGRPKGVMLDHRGRVNNFSDFQRRFKINSSDRLLSVSSLSFDICAYDVLGTLAAGAALVLPLPQLTHDPAHWAELISCHGVSIWHSVPAMLEMLVEHGEGAGSDLHSLRLALLGGDWIAVSLPDRIKSLSPGMLVVSLGGATEASVHSTIHLIEEVDPAWKSIPYGRPLANQKTYVLDKELQPQPVGIPGELHIGGQGLGAGYLNRPELTAEKFIPNPFSKEPGERVYKTGDLARYRPDGNLELLGRIDFQVKIRGFRVELGEIAAALRQHPQIQEAIVLATDNGSGGKSLTAYLVADAVREEPSFLKEIRDYLKAKLPAYMVPAAFVLLDKIPLTPNGKVDRKALSAMGPTPSVDPSAAPRTPLEESLTLLWSELLGREGIGIHDNFLDLGGHSLLATRLMSHVRTRWQVELPLRTIFQCPTIAELAVEIDKVQQSGEELTAPPLVHIPHDGTAVTSYAQQRLWFVEQLNPGTPAYNIPRVITLRGPLDIEILERSLNEIVRRHETLRTAFATQGAIQVIAGEVHLQLPVTDLSELALEQRQRKAERLSREEAARPFQLQHGPLIRAQLLRLDQEDYRLLLNMHHIISDGWSIGVFLRELGLLYTAFRAAQESPLPQLPVQYADYARWQREWLQAHVLEAQLAYWQEQLAGISALELPVKKGRPLVLRYRGQTVHYLITHELRERLHELSRAEGVTLYMTLLAAFQVLLARYSGQTDIVVGSPVANRTHSELEDLIGFFINMLVMRGHCSKRLDFRGLLSQVREVSLGAYAHQDVPFERLVEELHVQRDLSRHPLFQVAFALQNAPDAQLELQGLKVHVHEAEEPAAKFDLSLLVEEQRDGLHASLTYATDLFDHSMAERMMQSWRKVLEEIVKDPQQPIWEVELCTEEEKQQVLVDWNRTASPFPKDSSIQQLFEEQAARTPAAVAVRYDNEELSYEQLNKRANQLAHRLRQMGVQPETKVCVLMERGVEMVVGMLGVVKAAGTYVPLDLTYPTERLLLMIGDARPRVVLTAMQSRGVIDLQNALPDVQVLVLDEERSAIDLESDQNPENLNSSDNLLYVIYTSGSTGQPKGAGITHKAVSRLVKGSDYVQLDTTDRVAQVSNSSFDAITFELWGALLNGGQLIGISKDVALSPLALAAALKRERITALFLTTALFNQIAAEAPDAFSEMRHLLFGGEAVDVNSVREIVKHGKPERLLHVYGPTESTTFSTWFLIKDVEPDAHTIVIGRPISNTEAYVLDEQLNPVLVGVSGELYLGGAGLARGYLNQPELTAEKFIPNGFSASGGERLYRTGDLVRYQADGAIEFLGRADNQVKLRGFRIELNEIETVLMQHAEVREAVVQVHEQSVTDKRLVAYVVAEKGSALSGSGLRAHVREKLPEYMIPATFVQLTELPLTPNKKIDRRALPAPDWSSLGGSEELQRPRTPSEQLLVDIWAEVLGLEAEQLSIKDNFFELGGHSLLATQVVSRVRKIFRIELPVRVFFQDATIAGLAEWLGAQARFGGSSIAPPLEPVSRGEAQQLSFAQQRLWFLNELEPNQPFYNVPMGLRLTGPLDVQALEAVFNEIVHRHEPLRTTFINLDGHPRQKITPELKLSLDVTELQSLPPEEREAEAKRISQDEARIPFALDSGPLLRVRLLRLSTTEHVLLLTMHHIVSDGWSMGILLHEMSILYDAYRTGMASPLPRLTIQYVDFAHWQREWLRGEVLESQLSYWKRQLTGAPQVLELPGDRTRPPVLTYRGATLPLALPLELSRELQAVCRESGETLFMLLLAAFGVLMYRYTGQEDVLIGSPIANRGHAEIEGLIGFFVNTLVLRVRMDGDPTFAELLERVREISLEAYANQDVPFERLVEEMQPDRDLSRNPLFQVALTLQNAPMPMPDLKGLSLRLMAEQIETAKFDLNILLEETAQGITGQIIYSTDLFDTSTIVRFSDHFRTLLEAVAANPRQKISELALLTSSEQRQLLVEWNDTLSDYPKDLCVHELFEQQATLTPNAVAIVAGDEQLNYAELNSRANQLAHHLQSMGVTPEVLVGVCLERSIETIVGVLGILKAGGAYLPLDPEYPLERLSFMLEDGQVPVLLTQESLLEKLPAHWGQTVCVDTDAGAIAGQSKENLSGNACAENLAYVMYTSGSTGRPKGVSVTHRSIVRLVKETNYAEMGPAEVFLQMAPTSFDASTFEIWGALLNGAKLVLMPQQTPSLSELGSVLEKYGVTTLWLTAGLFHLMVDERVGDLRPVRQLLAGGDVLSVSHVNKLLQETDCTLINGYGPTEGTTFTCCYRTRDVIDAAGVPIGRPLSNTQVYLLDQQMQPAPTGVYGELYIGGDGVARCYLNRPEMTAEAFVPNPYGSGSRLYRTGDLARYRPDGNIEFLGRRDHQVKIRGFRIELGEIEAALQEHRAVREAVVLARKDRPGDERLVAYVISNGESSQLSDELRSYLREKLPDYMIPATFVYLDQLPLTANGKVDRQALPAPDWNEGAGQDELVLPRTQTEELMIGIWADILSLDAGRLSVNDNFFALGGHSLLATLILSRVRELFKIELSLRSLFHLPTIAEFSAEVDKALRSSERVQMLPITPAPRDEVLPLSFAQQRLWFLNQLEPGSPFYNVPTALHLTGRLYPKALERVFNEILRRHEALRTVFVNIDGKPVQIIAPEARIELEPVELGDMPANERDTAVDQLASREARTEFDLAQGPLLRVKLLRLAEDEHVLLLTMHHIISDGWSMGVLIREIATLYKAYVNGLPSPLPDLPVQYADFAHWQHQWVRDDILETQLAYWRKQLAGVATVLELPADFSRPAEQTHQGAISSFALSGGLSEQLRKLSQQSGATLYMLLLAAFNVLLYRYTGQRDILIGSPIANRNQAGSENLIGFFVNALLLRTDLGGDPAFEELLARVREAALEAYANQDVPFEKLVEELQPDRSLSRHPLFQVIFALQNASTERFNLPGLKVTPRPVDNRTAMFDLSLLMEESSSGLSSIVQYSTDLFKADTIRRMMGHFENLLEAIAADPKQRISEFQFLSPEEQQQLLVDWNNTSSDFGSESTIAELFETQVERFPDKAALLYGTGQISYSQLNERANQLAHFLREQGVKPETVVALCVERSPQMVIALLAILKAGGVYLPLDASYPKERLSVMLADARPSFLLTESGLLESFPEHSMRVCLLDEPLPQPALQRVDNPISETCSANLAYLMYTSGSTGRPKAIGVPHQGVIRLVKETNYASLSSDQVFLMFAPLGFDLSTFEVWGPLLNGGQLAIMDPHSGSTSEWAAAITGYGVTTLWLTASLFNLMVDEQVESLRGLKQLLAGGDVLSVEHVRRFLQEAPGCVFINGYGPTENTTFTSCHRMTEWDDEWTSVPIGRPVSNTEVYVLDEHLNLAPVGVSGELYLGGAGLARGYLNRPEMTAEKFIPNGFSATGGERLYRTGDLVRYQADGLLEFLGRADNQVKLRGFRIELNEIETVLMQHQAVREAVVLVQQESATGKRLVAYVIPETGASISSEVLRAHMREKLPEYMVPATFVPLTEFPLTPNKKVNRRALRAPDWASLGGSEDMQRPRTPSEQLLVDIWAEVLGLEAEQLSVHDNFFELGGHSLLATQVVSRIRKILNLELPVRRLFQYPTIEAAAEWLRREAGVKGAPAAPPIQPVSRSASLPLSFAQQRLWFLNQLEPNNSFYNIPVALRLQGELNVPALEATLNTIVRRHESLRTTFIAVDGQPVQVIANAQDVQIPLVQVPGSTADEREAECLRLVKEEGRQPFDLATGPLFRTRLLRISEAEHVLILTMHHIISDGWSMGILTQELSRHYSAVLNDRPSPLPELAVQYADFASWQREWLQGEVLETQLAYWKKQLDGAPTVLELPADYPRPLVQTYRGAHLDFQLPPALVEQLKELSRRSGSTLYMTLLAAFNVLLFRYTGQTDILVGSPIANRTRAETEGVIGFFVNTLVLRTRLDSDESFDKLLGRVKERALEAYANQDLPFEKLVEELQPDRNLNRHPLFQVAFASQNAPLPELELSGLRTSFFDYEAGTATFDLWVELFETGSGSSFSFEYNTDLFEPATVRRMCGHWQKLLEAVVGDPRQRISELPLLTDAEREQLLVQWRRTQTPDPTGLCIHQLFERVAGSQPDAPAVVFRGKQLSYGELNARANQLANYLRRLGAGVEKRVALCVDRSLEMAVGILGILKAGAAYVPLDPTYPRERLEYLLENAGATVLLTEQRHLESAVFAQRDAELQTLCLDRDWHLVAEHSEEMPGSDVSPENLAYIIYTSGSTGKPKGVAVTHRNLVHSTRARFSYYQKPVKGFLLLSSFAFDSSVAGIFWTLCGGGKLVLPEIDRQQDPGYLAELINHSHISHLLCLPSLYQLLLGQTKAETLGRLDAVIVAGEPCPPQLPATHNEKLANVALFNEYGPTEATVWSSVYDCRLETQRQSVPIGHAISNTQLYVLDRELNPVPVGISGELFIGGRGVTRGYLGKPKLTAERFIPDPFSEEVGARLYRTGDIARYLPGGDLEFLGRADHQVKVRGYRVELGEIETALREHPGVDEAVAIVRDWRATAPLAHGAGNGRNGKENAPAQLLERMGGLSYERAMRLLEEVEELRFEPEVSPRPELNVARNGLQRTRRDERFEVSLRLLNDQFIVPPREAQREWIVSKALQEFTADLLHMDGVSRRFVRGQTANGGDNGGNGAAAPHIGLGARQIMEDWQIPIMAAMAQVVTESNGDVLEVGFGRGISAGFVQQYQPRSHTIVECDARVIEDFGEWKKQYPGRDIRLIEGKWQDVADQLGIYDGIFFHTSTSTEEEFVEHVLQSVTYAEHFFPTAAEHLRKGGVFTYLTLEIDSFSRSHQRRILNYFDSLTLSVQKLTLPHDCQDMWWADSMVVVKAVK